MTTIYKIKELGLLTIETATGKARDLLDAAKRQLGFVPNMYGAMANEPALLEAYSTTYAAFRRDAGFTSIEQELIFLVISRANFCHYCMAAHSFVADKMSKVPTEVTDAIRDGRAIPDSRLQALATFTHVMVEMRGRPSEGAVREFLAAGYSEKNILGVILAIGVKTYSNYANHLFHTPVDDVFASRVWKEAA
ncbi:carboxymuconolactone decarboxylase family protein [Methylosinus sp. H3A]|uniref:carboxymuconolactone decarboxylase family protein n=1 Tax=Methylosinus sp. H3A TaxID=2785786 RepID=UPI0018C2356A|nr:carboxymuconolactone decarboxylase family protein [Methylosinus sp. H3A]MBG0808517.1 carboxymuconolactone decarboxylase family protein [Methylosinus sp. H3A]